MLNLWKVCQEEENIKNTKKNTKHKIPKKKHKAKNTKKNIKHKRTKKKKLDRKMEKALENLMIMMEQAQKERAETKMLIETKVGGL